VEIASGGPDMCSLRVLRKAGIVSFSNFCKNRNTECEGSLSLRIYVVRHGDIYLMAYPRSVITRSFTRVVGRVATGFRAVRGCLDDEGTPTSRVRITVQTGGSFSATFRYCAPLFSPLVNTHFHSILRACHEQRML